MAVRADTPIQFLKGVGPKLGDVLRKRGVSTVGDLLHWYPRAYEDRRAARSISTLVPNEIVSLKAKVVGVKSYNLGRSRRKIYDVAISDSSGVIHCKFFRTPYKGYFERFQPQKEVRVSGKVLNYRGQIEFHHPDIQDISDEEENADQLIPLYTETEGLSPTKIRKLMQVAVKELIDEPAPARKDYARKKYNEDVPLEEVEPLEKLPSWILEKYDMPQMDQALKDIHFPPKEASQDFSRLSSAQHRRVIFEEFFWLELYLAVKKSGLQKESAPVIEAHFSEIKKISEDLPFQLTHAQKKSLKQVIEDMALGHPMHRLVQGDVGSGKTLVALLSAAHVAAQKKQSALMAPTEILAEQHYKNAKKLLEPFGYKVGFLTGSQKATEKNKVIESLKNGEFDLCVGTHALIQDTVEFKDLALVIIDEQHRFGVHQRGRLKSKGRSPHFLVMTATPIPRTLAMTVYGDLDVSIIDEMPPGRQPIVTRVVYENKRSQVLGFLRQQIQKGRQAYVIYPLVEESEKMDLKDAQSAFENFRQQMSDVRFGLLHGKMKAEEKDQVMADFRDHKIDVLISTTVIEVGVDVPNANLILIEHSERFGLSQLHQLRGRVGRGEHKSYCVLMLGRAVSDESKERAQIMASTSDGFKISEADLELRGPGEFLGTRQSGLPGFRMANLVRDIQILQQARQAAFEVLKKDKSLSLNENHYLQKELLNQQGATSLAGIG